MQFTPKEKKGQILDLCTNIPDNLGETNWVLWHSQSAHMVSLIAIKQQSPKSKLHSGKFASSLQIPSPAIVWFLQDSKCRKMCQDS